MDTRDAADVIAELHEEKAEHAAADRFRNRAALLIAFLAAVLAIGGLGGGNATDDLLVNSIRTADTWAFYQAKNIRQTMYEIAADELGDAATLSPAASKRLAEYKATAARYQSEPDPAAPSDPLRGEGKKQLMAQAQAYEAARDRAMEQDTNFDLAEVALQLALVLGSVAILALNRAILGLSVGLGIVGLLLTVNGFLLLVPLGI